MNKKYKYNASDFEERPVTLEHMDISLNFLDGKVYGTNTLRLRLRQRAHKVVLDARDLQIDAVELVNPEGSKLLQFTYSPRVARLHIELPRSMDPGELVSIRTRTVCTPSDSVLEGIYRDTTPPGCPQQLMSQCQQWGFQRILPVIDDCTAKCTMTTTIEASAAYTHLISNGNVSRTTNPTGRPVPKPGEPGRQVITYENPIRMAPYLFLVCVGTWEMLVDEVTYLSGKTVRLEYLVPPGRLDGARLPMQILKDSILWQSRTQNYEYPHDVYRTICMEKSNFGGMENTGNTTIITSAALIDEYTGDRRLQYAHGVIVHEFEHNQCGSDVTMKTPFDMWLNEAFTVDVERRFLMARFDPTCTRLDQVDDIRAPLSGPLAIEDGGHLGNIVREGFNNPDELVDGVTYVKAAEVIRMLRLLLGEELFNKATNLYFSRYSGGNADTAMFFDCFKAAGAGDLAQFRKEWLHTIGYPNVSASYSYDRAGRRLHVALKQTRTGTGDSFHLPIALCGVDARGKDIPQTNAVVEMSGAEQRIAFLNVPEPAFVSFNRDCSFYGTFRDVSATVDSLLFQVRKDPSLFNRVEAMRRLTDDERIRLIESPASKISEYWLDLYGEILADRTLPPGVKAYLLRIDEQSLDRRYIPRYRERYAARRSLARAVTRRFMTDLTTCFAATDTYARGASLLDGFEPRRLKAVLLRAISFAETEHAWTLAEQHFHAAWHISDRLNALECLVAAGHPRRQDLLEEAYGMWHDKLAAYSSYLSIIGTSPHGDLFDSIRREEARPTFQIEHPNHSRSLYLPVASNNKMLWTLAGIRWLTVTVLRLSRINENTAIRLLACLQQARDLGDDLKPIVVAALKEMAQEVKKSQAPSVAGRIAAYLESAESGQ